MQTAHWRSRVAPRQLAEHIVSLLVSPRIVGGDDSVPANARQQASLSIRVLHDAGSRILDGSMRIIINKVINARTVPPSLLFPCQASFSTFSLEVGLSSRQRSPPLLSRPLHSVPYPRIQGGAFVSSFENKIIERMVGRYARRLRPSRKRKSLSPHSLSCAERLPSAKRSADGERGCYPLAW